MSVCAGLRCACACWVGGLSNSHLLPGLEDVAAEGITGAIPGDVAEDLQVLGVMRHVEDPGDKVWDGEPSSPRFRKGPRTPPGRQHPDERTWTFLGVSLVPGGFHLYVISHLYIIVSSILGGGGASRRLPLHGVLTCRWGLASLAFCSHPMSTPSSARTDAQGTISRFSQTWGLSN